MLIGRLSVLLACLGLLGLLLLSGCSEPSDLNAHMTEIRESGMTEMAQGLLHCVASIALGHTIISFNKDEANGMYFPSYQSTSCPSPEMDKAEIEASVAERTDRVNAIVPTLRRLADADGSGFVTTEEAIHFRQLVEFAYRASYVSAQEGGELEGICSGTGLAEDDLRAKAAEYAPVLEGAAAAGIELPEFRL